MSLMSMEGILTTYGQNGECYSIDGDGHVVCKPCSISYQHVIGCHCVELSSVLKVVRLSYLATVLLHISIHVSSTMKLSISLC